MKWFKHDSGAIKDEKIQAIMFEHGPAAYAIYFILCELCAEKIDKNRIPEVCISWGYLERLTHTKRAGIRRVLNSSSSVGLLAWDEVDQQLICKIPNLLKRLDNWTTNLLAANKSLANRSREVEKKEVEKAFPSKQKRQRTEGELQMIEDMKRQSEKRVAEAQGK